MPRIIDRQTFYTTYEVSQMLELTPQSIRTYIKQGKLKAEKVGRLGLLVLEEDLIAFILR